MTFSILARDAQTGRLGGAAATGSLCVGGWVLRGEADAGMSASQGTAPSTLWGTGALARMQEGETAAESVAAMVRPDTGRAHRQLSALDRAGGTGAFTGRDSIPACGARQHPGLVVTGNMLTHDAVLDAIADGFLSANGSFEERLIAALLAGQAAGSDSRGLQSAALLVVGADEPPLTLRIDYDPDPLTALRALHVRARSSPYADWCGVVPTLNDPHRSLPDVTADPEEAAAQAAGNG